MTRGTKNYFRHSFFAHESSKIVDLVSKNGKEAYYHFFVLVELCAKQYIEEGSGETTFKFHKRTICDKLLVTPSRLGGHLLAIQSSLGGEWVVTDSTVEIKYASIPKYLGSYDSYMPQLNKTKSNKIKLNKTNNDEKVPSFDLESVYQKYPRKVGKAGGMKKAISQIKTIDQFNSLVIAVENYSKSVEAKQTDVKYIKHFDTFMSSWQDWVRPDESEMNPILNGKVDLTKHTQNLIDNNPFRKDRENEQRNNI